MIWFCKSRFGLVNYQAQCYGFTNLNLQNKTLAIVNTKFSISSR